MNKLPFITYCAAAVILSFTAVTAQTIYREVKRTNEKEVTVRISSSFGSVNVSKGNADNIVQIAYRKKTDDKSPNIDIDYSLRNSVGDLDIELHPENSTSTRSRSGDVSVHVKDLNFKTDEWYVSLTDAVPIALEAELGAGKSNFDLSGLHLTELAISTGASKSILSFDIKNKGEIPELRIETGVSKFTAENLNNANFKRMSFESGVGSYYLDFGGDLNRTVDVTVNVGLGSVTVVIPRKIGVKVRYEDSWLSNLTIDDEFIRKRKGNYESENYDSAEGRMNIFIESGLGSVRVRRSK
jgi:predicted membrane protein